MMHKGKGQHIGKAPSLHLFHATVIHAWGSSLNVPQLHNLDWQFMAVASFSGHFLLPHAT